MSLGRIGLLLLLGAVASAQQTPAATPMESTPPPALPVINSKACPQPNLAGETKSIKLIHDQRMYSTWRDNRSAIAMLRSGDTVTMLSGLEVIRKPDQAVLTESGATELTHEGLTFKRGDVVLRYGLRDDGSWDFWAKGAWFEFYYEYEGDLKGSCGFSVKSTCTFAVMKDGAREWWIKVKSSRNRVGWVRAHRYWEKGKCPALGNFCDICLLD
jgi:hypothetical protein